MNRTVYAHQGETLDQVLHRIYRTTAVITEQTLELNPRLADQGPVLEEGTAIKLPPPPMTQNPLIQLWT